MWGFIVVAKVLGLSRESSGELLKGPKQGSDMIRSRFQKDHSSCKEKNTLKGYLSGFLPSPCLLFALILLFPFADVQAVVSRTASSSLGKFRFAFQGNLH